MDLAYTYYALLDFIIAPHRMCIAAFSWKNTHIIAQITAYTLSYQELDGIAL